MDETSALGQHSESSTAADSAVPCTELPKQGPGGLEGRQPQHPRHNRAGSPWSGSPGGGAAPACCAGSGPRAALRREGQDRTQDRRAGAGFSWGGPHLMQPPSCPQAAALHPGSGSPTRHHPAPPCSYGHPLPTRQRQLQCIGQHVPPLGVVSHTLLQPQGQLGHHLQVGGMGKGGGGPRAVRGECREADNEVAAC